VDQEATQLCDSHVVHRRLIVGTGGGSVGGGVQEPVGVFRLLSRSETLILFTSSSVIADCVMGISL